MKALRRTGLRRLLLGQGISALGDWMATVAFMAIVHEITRSPTAVGGILVLRVFPGIVAAPLGSRPARRWGMKRTMLAMDITRAAIVFAIPFLQAIWWIYMWAFILEVASLLFLPARDSSIPSLVGEEDEIPMANSFVLGSSYGTIPLGAGVFALIATFTDGATTYFTVFWLDSLTFLASFAMIRGIPELGDSGRLQEESKGEGFGSIRQAFRIPLVRGVMGPTTAIVLGLGSLFSLGIVFVQEVLGATTTQFGILIALFGLGTVIGLVLIQFKHESGSVNDVRIGVMVVGAMVFTMSMTTVIPLVFLGAAGFGAGGGYALVAGMSLLQERLRGEERILAFSAFHIILRGGLGIGAIGAGAAGDLLGRVQWPLLGRLASTQVVLLSAGALILLSSLMVRESPGREPAS